MNKILTSYSSQQTPDTKLSCTEHYTGKVAKLAPLFTLYKPFAQATALGLGSIRTIVSLDDFRQAINEGKLPVMAGLYTLFNAATVAGTIFAHPMGMLMSAAMDLHTSSLRLSTSLNSGEYKEAMEQTGKILSNALYMACFFAGGIQLRIAALAFQIGMGLYQAKKAYNEESYLEVAGHLVMIALLGRELRQLTMPLQAQEIAVGQVQKNAHGTEKKQRPPAPEKVQQNDPEFSTDVNTYKIRRGTAQYGGSDYSGAMRVERGISLKEALEIADKDSNIDYFFRMYDGAKMVLPTNQTSNDPLHLISQPVRFTYDSGEPGYGSLRIFQGGDTVFFARKPGEGDWGGMWLGSARGYADTYVKL